MSCSRNASSPEIVALLRDLLEQAHAALERLREALLLGGEDAVDLVPVLLELGIAVPHLLDHDVRETREVRRLEPDARACCTARRMMRRMT